MRAKAPSWLVSNFLNVLVLAFRFCFEFRLTLVYDILPKNARAFFDNFLGGFAQVWKSLGVENPNRWG